MSQALLEHLEKETQYYQCLLQLQVAAQEFLIHNQRVELDLNTEQQEKCTQLILLATETRQKLAQEVHPKASTFNALLPHIQDIPLRVQIQAGKQKIEGLLTLIQNQAKRNQTLIHQGLKYVEHSMDLMGQMALSQTPQTYSLYGQLQQGALSNSASCDFNA